MKYNKPTIEVLGEAVGVIQGARQMEALRRLKSPSRCMIWTSNTATRR